MADVIDALQHKPRYGTPCNGCGACCRAEICSIGKMAFPDAVAPCPGLIAHDGRTFCKLVEVERLAGMEPMIANALGIGKGCCGADDDPVTLLLMRLVA